MIFFDRIARRKLGVARFTGGRRVAIAIFAIGLWTSVTPRLDARGPEDSSRDARGTYNRPPPRGDGSHRRRWKELPREDRQALRKFFSQLNPETRERFLRLFRQLSHEGRKRLLRRVRRLLGKLSDTERGRLLDTNRPREERLRELDRILDDRKHDLIEEKRRFIEEKKKGLPPEVQNRIRDLPLPRQARLIHRHLANQLFESTFPDENARKRLIVLRHRVWRALRESPDQKPEGFPDELWSTWKTLEGRKRHMLMRHVGHEKQKEHRKRFRQKFRKTFPEDKNRRILSELKPRQLKGLRETPNKQPDFLPDNLWEKWRGLDSKEQSKLLRFLRHRQRGKGKLHRGRSHHEERGRGFRRKRQNFRDRD